MFYVGHFSPCGCGSSGNVINTDPQSTICGGHKGAQKPHHRWYVVNLIWVFLHFGLKPHFCLT